MIRLVNIDDLSPTSPAWEDVLKLEIWEPKDVVLWYLTQNNITRIDDTRRGYEKTYKLVQCGKWKTVGMYTVECSECKSQLHELECTNFCPNCGAKMTGE